MLRRVALAAIGALVVIGAFAPASALTLSVKQALGPPGWVLPLNPDIQVEFTRAAAWKGTGTGGGAVVPPESLLVVTRASVAMLDNLAGQWREFPTGVLRYTDKGGITEGARTNLALWCRDLTNAVWVKVTMTTAKTATGIDGTANAATTITAAGASSTILQTVVQVSTADTVSLFVRRRTGTGTIEVTANGVAFTDITAALAAAATATPGGWYRATISATLANPVIGLRITTSGDAVDVDFAQLEAGTFVSTPILTTTVAVARAFEFETITPTYGFGSRWTSYARFTPIAPTTFATFQSALALANGANNFFLLRRVGATGRAAIAVTANSVATVVTLAETFAQGTEYKFAASTDGVGNVAGAINGGAPQTGTYADTFALLPIVFQVGNVAGSQPSFSYLKSSAAWGSRAFDGPTLQFISR